MILYIIYLSWNRQASLFLNHLKPKITIFTHLSRRYRPSKQLNVSSVTYLQILEIANKRVSSEDSLPNEPSKSKYTLWSTKKSEKNILKFLFLTVNMECDDRTAFVVTTLTIIASKVFISVIFSVIFIQLVFLVIVMILLCLLLNLLPDLRQSYSIFLISFFSAILIILSILIYRQPQNQDIKTFKVCWIYNCITSFIYIYDKRH